MADITEYKADKDIEDHEYNGFKLRIRKNYRDENVVKEIFYENHYRIPKQLRIVIDIGANIGTFSLLAARAGAEVYAFEPEQYNYEILCYNAEINGYQDKIHCIKAGVGTPGKTKLYVHPDNAGGTSAYFNIAKGLDVKKYQIVDFISIHEVFDKYNIKYCDLLKLDCEGSENEIIRDLDDGLVSRIGQISAELHNNKLKEGFLKKLGKWFKAENTSRRNRIWVFTKMKTLLHVGCGNRIYEGFINSDKNVHGRPIEEMDLAKPWPYADESVDGIVSMHVLQQLTWRELVVALSESYRVLKKGGVMRFGAPIVEMEDRSLEYLLGWNNINLFSFDLLERVLVGRIGYSQIKKHWSRRSAMPELARLDNRHNRGTIYIEVMK